MAKDLGLIVFCWGDDNNSKDTIKYLKDKGLHAIIYDKVDVLIEAKVTLRWLEACIGLNFSSSHGCFCTRDEIGVMRGA